MIMDFLRGMTERMAYGAWIDSLRSERHPADSRGLTECVQCGCCCAQRTCVPTVNELPIIADFLGITVQEMVNQYMVGDRMQGHEFLRWANTAQTDILGEFLGDWRTYDKGDCILFENGCRIHSVLPADAATHGCWIEDRSDEDMYRAIRSWNDGDMEQFGVEEEFYDGWDAEDDW